MVCFFKHLHLIHSLKSSTTDIIQVENAVEADRWFTKRVLKEELFRLTSSPVAPSPSPPSPSLADAFAPRPRRQVAAHPALPSPRQAAESSGVALDTTTETQGPAKRSRGGRRVPAVVAKDDKGKDEDDDDDEEASVPPPPKRRRVSRPTTRKPRAPRGKKVAEKEEEEVEEEDTGRLAAEPMEFAYDPEDRSHREFFPFLGGYVSTEASPYYAGPLVRLAGLSGQDPDDLPEPNPIPAKQFEGQKRGKFFSSSLKNSKNPLRWSGKSLIGFIPAYSFCVNFRTPADARPPR